jgi:hypothetical protein
MPPAVADYRLARQRHRLPAPCCRRAAHRSPGRFCPSVAAAPAGHGCRTHWPHRCERQSQGLARASGRYRLNFGPGRRPRGWRQQRGRSQRNERKHSQTEVSTATRPWFLSVIEKMPNQSASHCAARFEMQSLSHSLIWCCFNPRSSTQHAGVAASPPPARQDPTSASTLPLPDAISD